MRLSRTNTRFKRLACSVTSERVSVRKGVSEMKKKAKLQVKCTHGVIVPAACGFGHAFLAARVQGLHSAPALVTCAAHAAHSLQRCVKSHYCRINTHPTSFPVVWLPQESHNGSQRCVLLPGGCRACVVHSVHYVNFIFQFILFECFEHKNATCCIFLSHNCKRISFWRRG